MVIWTPRVARWMEFEGKKVLLKPGVDFIEDGSPIMAQLDDAALRLVEVKYPAPAAEKTHKAAAPPKPAPTKES